MWHTTKLYILVLLIFLAIDMLWLGVIMSKFYKTELGVLARRTGENLAPIWWAAFVVYLLIPLGIILFVLPRAVQGGSPFIWGFIYGVILYGVYDFTNYALVANWPWRMTVVDILWGGWICAFTSRVAFFLDRWLT